MVEVGATTSTPAELTLFRLLVESVPDYAIFMIDPTGRVMTWNRGAERIKGYRAGEIVGQHFSRFYPAEDVRAGKCEHELESALRDGRYEDEGWRVRKDGSRFWANVIFTPLHGPAGELVGFAKVTRDRTEQRAADEERLRLVQAREAVRLRDEFLSIASHELRTPLTALDLQVRGLIEGEVSPDPRTAKKLLRIERSSARLLALVDVLLDVSRIATGRLTLTCAPGDLVTMTRDVVDRLAERAANASCTVTLEVRVECAPGAWDTLRMEQAITNVLDNAFRYGSGKPVHVTVDSGPGAITIVVDDLGPGIPEPDLERIFQRFERASAPRNYGGLGLGLYVSREIVTAHGGTITAANRAGGGARITVRVPTSLPAAVIPP